MFNIIQADSPSALADAINAAVDTARSAGEIFELVGHPFSTPHYGASLMQTVYSQAPTELSYSISRVAGVNDPPPAAPTLRDDELKTVLADLEGQSSTHSEGWLEAIAAVRGHMFGEQPSTEEAAGPV